MKNKLRNIILLVVITAFIGTGCVKPFTGPSSIANTSFLVVDGTVTVGKPIKIKLSRTKNLVDTVTTIPENGAQMQLESESGNVFPFVSSGGGQYIADGATALEKYRLRIHTQNGKEYLSDFVETKVSPPIDSVNWVEDDDIFIYVNSHDEHGTTRYYRWEFDETSEYHAVYDSNLDFRNGELIFIPPSEYRYKCYRDYASEGILIANSGALGQDVISKFLVTRIPNDNSKISFRYSILVKQYALQPDAYQYWQIVKQNSEQTGNIFDPQPSQLYGNIKCVSDPEEPVIGYVSATTVSEQRIFIRQTELDVIKYPDNKLCKEIFINPNEAADYLSTGQLLPAYFTNGALAIAPPVCVDCRLSGGTTNKPSFW